MAIVEVNKFMKTQVGTNASKESSKRVKKRPADSRTTKAAARGRIDHHNRTRKYGLKRETPFQDVMFALVFFTKEDKQARSRLP